MGCSCVLPAIRSGSLFVFLLMLLNEVPSQICASSEPQVEKIAHAPRDFIPLGAMNFAIALLETASQSTKDCAHMHSLQAFWIFWLSSLASGNMISVKK
jgi:hypothetical protein